MSVLKSQRSESGVQYLNNAREIELLLYDVTSKFPKRYRPTLVNDIIKLSHSVVNNLVSSNSIRVTSARELQYKLDYLMYANDSLQCLITQVGIAQQLITDVSDKRWLNIGLLLNEEARLISGVRKYVLKQYAEFATCL